MNMMAVGERTRHWPGHEDFFILNVAEQISSGIISSGHLQRGADGAAGDLGHIQLSRSGDTLCSCGNHGCLEALASVPAITCQLRSNGLDVKEETDICQLMAAGNTHAIQTARQAGRDIGDVLATVVNLLNPAVIVVGGLLTELGEQVVAGIREVIYRRCPPLATSGRQVAASSAGNYAAIYGASASAIQHVLSPAAIQANLTSSP
ncbi:ROK family protein [Arthrobacter sp. 92]|uniref:ROK family protein n=1 Tax=Arthrobacter sp. 92 TaxID=3418175 RepID=UPI003D053F9A